MIDTTAARRAHEAALRALTMYEFALRDLGVPLDDADSRRLEAHTEWVPADGKVVARDPSSPATAERALTAAAKNCERCGKEYRPHPKGAHRAKFCSPRCRQAVVAQRHREREDAKWRERTEELKRLHPLNGGMDLG